MLKPGQIAPDFAIPGGSLYQILEQRSAVVFFFPMAFTPGCAREAGIFRMEFANLQRAGCDVVGVSQDTQDTNDRFRASLDLPFPLVGDPEGRILRDYGVRWPIVGLAQRVTYLIGRSKKVRLAFHSEFSMKAHAARACEAAVAEATPHLP